MTALASVRRRRTLAALGAGAVAALVLVALVAVGLDALRTSREGRRADALPAGRTLPPTPAALYAVRDDDGELTSLWALALAPPGEGGAARGGTVLLLPVGAANQVGDDEARVRLADEYRDGGINRLSDAAGALLGVNFSLVAELDETRLVGLLQPVGSVEAVFTADVFDARSGSPDVLVMAAGTQLVRPREAAALMTAQRLVEPESVRYEQLANYWAGLQNQVGAGVPELQGGPGSVESPASAVEFFGAVMSGPVRVFPFSADPIPRGPANPDGDDAYSLDAAEVTRVVATVLPDAVSPVDVVFTVQIVNPTGDPALTEEAIRRIAAPGVAVVLVRELAQVEVPALTEASYGGRATPSTVEPYLVGLGDVAEAPLGLPGTPHGRVLGVDVNLVLGADFVALVELEGGADTVEPSDDSKPSTTEDAG